MTAPSSPDPATPQWTWTDEARQALVVAVQEWWDDGGEPGEYDEDGDWVVLPDAVLAALAPHVARPVAELTAEVKRLRIALATVNTSFDAVSAREAIRSELITQGLAAAEQVDALQRQVAGLEAENDNYHADLIRVIGERDAAQAKVDAVKALHQADGFASCRHCGYIWPCPTYRAVAADPQRPVLPPEDAQEPQTPAPGSPGTPGTLSVPLSAPRDPHGA